MLDDERLENLLMAVSAGDRDAFRDLFNDAAPAMAAWLAFHGVDERAAKPAIIATFAQLWEGEYSSALRPGQTLSDWVQALALDHVAGHRPQPTPGHQTPPVAIDDALWKAVARRAFPENWRNFVRRSDVLFAIIGAVAWAVILRLFAG